MLNQFAIARENLKRAIQGSAATGDETQDTVQRYG
jgi:hypothetical protein